MLPTDEKLALNKKKLLLRPKTKLFHIHLPLEEEALPTTKNMGFTPTKVAAKKQRKLIRTKQNLLQTKTKNCFEKQKNLLFEKEAFGMVDVLVFPVFHPNPKRLHGSVELVLQYRSRRSSWAVCYSDKYIKKTLTEKVYKKTTNTYGISCHYERFATANDN